MAHMYKTFHKYLFDYYVSKLQAFKLGGKVEESSILLSIVCIIPLLLQ